MAVEALQLSKNAGSSATGRGRKPRHLVVLVKPEQDRNIHPLGLIYMGDAVKKAGFDVRCYFVAPEDMRPIAEEIVCLRPIFVGISLLTGVQVKVGADLSEHLKTLDPELPIVWGGVHPTIDPVMCLNEPFVDIIVDGDGEEAGIDLALCLANGGDLAQVLGIVYKVDGELRRTAKRPMLMDLDKYAPDWSLINMEHHVVEYEGQRTAEFITSRGCPFNCGFCSVPVTSNRRWRKHSDEFVRDGLAYLRREHDITNVIFCDDLISTNTKRMLELLKVSREVGMSIATCQIRLDGINKEILDSLVESNVKRVFIGIESGSDNMLRLVRKGFNRQRIIEQFKLIAQYPIAVTAPLIIGYPTDTWEDIYQTVDLAVEMAEIIPATVVTIQTYNPYPGSDLYHLAIKEGFKPPQSVYEYDDYDVFFASFDLTWLPWADKDTIRRFHIIDGYAKMLTHDSSNTWIRTIGKKLLYEAARFRMKRRFFRIPFEVFLMYKFNRYYSASFAQAAEWLGYNKKRRQWKFQKATHTAAYGSTKREFVQTPYVDGR